MVLEWKGRVFRRERRKLEANELEVREFQTRSLSKRFGGLMQNREPATASRGYVAKICFAFSRTLSKMQRNALCLSGQSAVRIVNLLNSSGRND